MWAIEEKAIRGGVEYRVMCEEVPVTRGEAYGLLAESGAFRTIFNGMLKGCGMSAYRWETPALCRGNLKEAFECVVLAAPELDVRPDPRPFAEHIGERDSVVTFQNLGGDATLVAPTLPGSGAGYAHLARFVRTAPEAVINQFWKTVGEVVLAHIGRQKLWVSTAGGGVSWLHLRLDRKPKYYAHAPYKRD